MSAGPRPRVPSPQRGDPRVAPGGPRGAAAGRAPPGERLRLSAGPAGARPARGAGARRCPPRTAAPRSSPCRQVRAPRLGSGKPPPGGAGRAGGWGSATPPRGRAGGPGGVRGPPAHLVPLLLPSAGARRGQEPPAGPAEGGRGWCGAGDEAPVERCSQVRGAGHGASRVSRPARGGAVCFAAGSTLGAAMLGSEVG